jgi:MYB-related transcription factor LHY
MMRSLWRGWRAPRAPVWEPLKGPARLARNARQRCCPRTRSCVAPDVRTGHVWLQHPHGPPAAHDAGGFKAASLRYPLILVQTRKPYTITKQREKWTDQEHGRFLEALRMYGRAWRRIEGAAPCCVALARALPVASTSCVCLSVPPWDVQKLSAVHRAEHIGTKTAVQIRSHAQKFFSKLEKQELSGAKAEGTCPRCFEVSVHHKYQFL